jgi:hypothetical protein
VLHLTVCPPVDETHPHIGHAKDGDGPEANACGRGADGGAFSAACGQRDEVHRPWLARLVEDPGVGTFVHQDSSAGGVDGFVIVTTGPEQGKQRWRLSDRHAACG